MIWLVLIGLAVVTYLILRADHRKGRVGSAPYGRSTTIREGKTVTTDTAFEAWTSGDLEEMIAALDAKTNKIDRHFLLQNIVQACYKARDDPKMRTTCLRVGRLHLDEFSSIAPALKREMGGFLPRVTTFQHLATVLSEDGHFQEAIEVCETALKFGLHDRTKSGFEGRIARIRKKQQASARG